MNKTIKYPLAKLLKKKGFDRFTDKIYLSEYNMKLQRDLLNYPKSLYPDAISAPTIADVVMWLLEKHRIWIEVSFNREESTFQWKINDSLGRFKEITPGRAYEAAIEYTLNKLI